MPMTPVERFLAALFLKTGRKPTQTANGWQTICPSHDDHKPSLSVTEGDDGRVLWHCHAGCEPPAVVEEIGLTMANLMPINRAFVDRTPKSLRKQRVVSTSAQVDADERTFPTAALAVAELERRHGPSSVTFPYHDADGVQVGVVVRWDRPKGKDIRPVSRRGDQWIIRGMPQPTPLYCLPDLAVPNRVFVTEGEKAADAAREIGLTATTSPHGSKSASKADWTPLAGKECVLLPDNDKAGTEYAEAVAEILVALTPPAVVKVVELPDPPDRGDMADFVTAHAGTDAGELRRTVEALADRAEVIIPERPAASTVEAEVTASGRVGTEAVLINLADVQPEQVRWLWPGCIALGKVTVIAGDPGLGKSFLTLDMAARVTKGYSWPDGTEGMSGSVILLSAEDDLADTIRPRLDAADADPSRITALDMVRDMDPHTGDSVLHAFSLQRDLAVLGETLGQSPDCRLIIIDPITAYLGGADSHNNADVRGLLAPLTAMAAQYRVAVVAITHLNKSSKQPAMYRTMGSIAFVAAARAAWLVTKDKDDPTGQRRLFLVMKNNISADKTGMAFRLRGKPDEEGAAVVEWEPDQVLIRADDALAADQADYGGKSSLNEAMNWLQEMLSDGSVGAKELKKRARDDGISARTLDRAKSSLGVLAFREGFGADGQWTWSLPDQKVPSALPSKPLAPFGDFGALCVKPQRNGRSEGAQQPESSKERQSTDTDDEWGEL